MTHKKITIDGIDYELIPVTKEVVQKEWEIVSFWCNNKLFTKSDFAPNYPYKSKEGSVTDFNESMGDNIHSVKRISDGEVFSVGDEVSWNKGVNVNRILGFTISKNNGIMLATHSFGGVGINNLTKVTKLTTPTTFQWTDELVEEVIYWAGHSLISQEQSADYVKRFKFIKSPSDKASKQLNKGNTYEELENKMDKKYSEENMNILKQQLNTTKEEWLGEQKKKFPYWGGENIEWSDEPQSATVKLSKENLSSQPQNNKERADNETVTVTITKDQHYQVSSMPDLKLYDEAQVLELEKKAFEAAKEYADGYRGSHHFAKYPTFQDYKNSIHKS